MCTYYNLRWAINLCCGGGLPIYCLSYAKPGFTCPKKNDTEAVNIENCLPFAEYFDKYEDDLQAAIIVSVSLDLITEIL